MNKTIEFHQLKKTEGEWKYEPDKMQWVDPETKLDCMIVRHDRLYHLCGYVGVPKSHSCFGKNYDDVYVEVHGGLTFSEKCNPEPNDMGICHIKELGTNEEVFWFGFDCAHLGDKSPGMEKYSFNKTDQYRNFAYLIEQTINLAKQLKELNHE